MEKEETGFLEKMGLLDAVFLVMGGVIGSGIFMTTGFIAEFVPSAWMILLVWIVGGLITVCGALSFAELGAMFPRAGGQFVYLKEAYGDWAGFLFGWAFFWVIECGGIAALAVGFAEYFGYFLPAFSPQTTLVRGSFWSIAFSISSGQLVAVAAILILSGINYVGIKSGVVVQNLFMVMRLASLAAIVGGGLFFGKKEGIESFGSLVASSGRFSLKFMSLALFAVLWTYDGWYSVSCTAEEIKNPRKNIPLSLVFGTLGVTLIYVLVNVVYLLAIPVAKMKGVARVGELVATSLLGDKAASLIAGGIAITIFGCLSATIIYGPRVFYAMARDNLFFKRMSWIHPKYRVPTVAIAGQAIWSSLLCLSGTYQTLYEYVIFALVLFFAGTGAAVFVLRQKQPRRERPYRVWGYPLLPLIFVVINLAIFLNSIFSQPFESLLGLAIIGLGLPGYFFWKRRKRASVGQ